MTIYFVFVKDFVVLSLSKVFRNTLDRRCTIIGRNICPVLLSLMSVLHPEGGGVGRSCLLHEEVPGPVSAPM